MHTLSAYNRPFPFILGKAISIWGPYFQIPLHDVNIMVSRRYYFAYGSNLSDADWHAWCEERGYDSTARTPVEPAWLPNYSMRFHYYSHGRGGGAADVVADGAGTAVPGMLFSLTEEGWAWMDQKEGHPRYYERQPVFVLTSAGDVVETITYVVVPQRRTSELVPPTTAYADVVKEGLQHYNLPIGHLKNAIGNFESKSALQHVFVYGTLMQGESRWSQLERWSCGPVHEGQISGRLFHLGRYPGMRPNEVGVVHGEVHRCNDIENCLGVLDSIEGVDDDDGSQGLYLRLPVPVKVGNDIIWAWSYVINRLPTGATPIDDGRWCSDYSSSNRTAP